MFIQLSSQKYFKLLIPTDKYFDFTDNNMQKILTFNRRNVMDIGR